MSAAIRVHGVSKRFRIPLDRSTTLKYRVTHLRSSGRFQDLYALRDITFDVRRGEFLGIIGGNGCGKTTLLKILSRIYEPTDGSIDVTGRVSPFLELGVGFNPELTARENVFVNGAVLGLTRSELRARFDEIIDFADLRDFVDQKLKNFSSGMQVRLAFSVAIQANAEILLMDEVLAVGDAQFQEKCFDVFWRYKREGKTVVLVTHDLGAVENYCDRAILIDHGRIQADGSGRDVIAKYRRMVEATFAERASAPSPSANGAPSAPIERFGSGEIVITDVRVLDQAGHATSAIRSGCGLRVQIEFEARSDVGEVVFGMQLHRADGVHVFGSDNRAAAPDVSGRSAGTRGRVTYAIDRLPLLAGSYLISASVYDRHTQHAYDDIRMAFPLRVTEGSQSSGIVELDGRWVGS